MESMKFDKNKLIAFWTESSKDDFETMLALYEKSKNHWALFIGHLMIEKLLKALFVKVNNDYPPYTHNLLRLAEKSNIEISEEQKLFFITVTAFNINARYDDYKKSFRNKCTPEYTALWIENLKTNRIWIQQLIAL